MLEPTEEKFENLRKDNLIALGKHLSKEIKGHMQKHGIQRVIMEHLVQQETFEQSALGKYQHKQTENRTEKSNSQVPEQQSSNELDRERRQ